MTKLENIKLDGRYTIVASDSSILGTNQCKVIKCTIKDIQLVQYAQYKNALQIRYRQYRGRKDNILTITTETICILKGFHDIDSSIKTQLDKISFTSKANDPKNYFNNSNTVFCKDKGVINTNNDFDLFIDVVCDYKTDRILSGEDKEDIKDSNYYNFLKDTLIKNNISLSNDLFDYLKDEGYDELINDLKKIRFTIDTIEVKEEFLKDPENLYSFIKNTFFENVNKLRSNDSYKAFRKFINTYLQELNINHIRIEHLSINGFKKILTECKTLKEFKRVMNLIGKEYGSKCVVDTYSNMIDDLNVFQEDGDIEEVEEIKQQLKNGTMLTSNLLIY